MLGEMNNNVQSGAENERENWKRKNKKKIIVLN